MTIDLAKLREPFDESDVEWRVSRAGRAKDEIAVNKIEVPALTQEPRTERLTVSEAAYHEIPFLSSSLLKRCLENPESIPKAKQPIGKTLQRAFDFGHLVEDLLGWGNHSLRDSADYALAQECAHNLRNHPEAGPLIRNCEHQVPIIWPSLPLHQAHHKEGWYQCKSLIDIWPNDRYIIADLKTSKNPDPDGFQKDAWNLKYDLQEAFYLEAIEQLTGHPHQWVWIVVGNYASKTPGKVWVYHDENDRWRDLGRARMSEAFDIYWRGMTTGRWERYNSRVINVLEPPRYARYQV